MRLYPDEKFALDEIIKNLDAEVYLFGSRVDDHQKCDRFIRAVEVYIKFFKTYEYIFFATKADSLRDILNIMEKNSLITNTPIWLDMRDVRNKIVHDYLPQQIQAMYDAIMCEFFIELQYFENQIMKIAT